mmetsp:Transcript_16495/g.47090  ORF Transcript_16495/g.47090 Transcript_16495/m.47090 type:complete len:295 (+) Transcript_16495:108-992(+)
MGLRTLVPILALLAPSSAVPDEDSHQPVGSALVGDDECSAGAGGCGLHALQRRSDLLSEEAEGKPALEDEKFPLHVANGAGNDVVLANCLQAFELAPGEEIAMGMPVTGGFWVMPADADFNCSLGCEDCFYVAMDWTVTKGASVRIGFGLDVNGTVAQPQGGGIGLSVPKVGSTRCTDKSCKEGWTAALPVDLDTSSVSVIIHGSESAEPMGNDTELEAARRGGRGGRGRRGIRRGFRRGFRRGRRGWRRGRRGFRHGFRRPIYRPFRRGIGPFPATCFYCHQYGLTTCWWLCR